MFTGALRRSALGEVRHSPRFVALMLVMLVAAIGYGGRDVSRLRYTTELTGDALGIGIAAALFAVGLAIGGLVSGPISDRFDPRRLLIVGIVLQGVVSLATAALLLNDVTADSAFVALTLVDGIFAGACIPALATTQAAMVPSGARGAAEIISILRLGIGAALGLFLANLSPSPGVTLIAVGVVLCLVAWPIAVITRPVPIPRRGDEREATGRVLATLASHPVLRRVVVADLVLCVAVPTQFANVILASDWEESLVTPVLVSGVLGVLVGRLTLSLTGSHGVVRRELLESYGTFVALALLGIPLIATSVIYTAVWIPGVVGSATTAYAQGLLAALVQQQVPDEVRGRLTGGMAAARSLLIAGSAILLTAVVVPLSATAAAVLVALLGVGALVVLRSFRGVTADAG